MPFDILPPGNRTNGTMVTTDQWNADVVGNIRSFADPRGCRITDNASQSYTSGSGAFFVPPVTALTWWNGGAQFQIQHMGDIVPANQAISSIDMVYFRYPGKYFIEAEMSFSANATGYRKMQLGLNQGSAIQYCYATGLGHATENTILHADTLVNVSFTNTQTTSIVVFALQNSGSSLSGNLSLSATFLGE